MALRQLFADYWRWHLAAEPEDATRVGVHAFDDRWHDRSKSGRAAARERRQEFLRNFQYASLGNLTNPERMSVTLVQQRLASELATESLRLMARLSPDAGGAHQEVFRVVSAMPAESVADFERLLARLRALPAYAEQHIELWSEQLADGLAQPASVVDRVAADIEAQRRVSAESSPLLTAFRSMPETIPSSERARLERAARNAYDEQVLPAWERLERFLRDTYRPRSRASVGIGRLAPSQGYSDLLAFYGAPSVSVEALHEQAMSATARPEQRAAQGRAAGRHESATAIPEFRRHLLLPAFEEGWQAYAGGSTRVTAARAALDSGIHARGWTAEQASAFASSHFGETDAARVVDLVAATPGRALAVFAAAQKFAELRRRAEARLGARFDEAEFDRAVFEGGVLPLDLVELQLEGLSKLRPAR